MECKIKKDEYFRHPIFALTQCSKTAKAGDFYQQGIENIVECCEEVVSNNGEYIID